MLALEATTSAISYIAVAVLLGQVVVAGFLLPRGQAVMLRASLLAWARASLLLFLCAAFFALLVQGAKLQDGFPSVEVLWRYLTMTQSGKVWLVRELYGIVLFVDSLTSAATKGERRKASLSGRGFVASITRRP